jgi:tRNA U34 5-methylaminomethyl-2-thiouridine-forming methyltransferase MnmC
MLYKIHEDITRYIWDATYDLCYFDAFAPDKQPSLWERAIFNNIFNALTSGGILVTYSAKGTFRRTLAEIGFTVEKRPGPGIKRNMTVAIKP